MQACFLNGHSTKALSLLDRIFEDGLCPDRKTYGALVRGFLYMGQLDKAVEWVQRACQGESPVGVDSQCFEDVVARLKGHNETASALRKLVEETWHRQQIHPQLGSEMKATVRSGRENRKERSPTEAPKVRAAKQGKRRSFSESSPSMLISTAASAPCSTATS